MSTKARFIVLGLIIFFVSTKAAAKNPELDFNSPVVGSSTIQDDAIRQQEAIAAQVRQWGEKTKNSLIRIQTRINILKSQKIPLDSDIPVLTQNLQILIGQAQRGSQDFDFYQALQIQQELDDKLVAAEQILQIPKNLDNARKEIAKAQKDLFSSKMKAEYYRNDLSDIFTSWQLAIDEMQNIYNQANYFYSSGQFVKSSELILIKFSQALELAQEKEELSIWAYNRNNTAKYIQQHIDNMHNRMDYAKAKGKNTATLEKYFNQANDLSKEINNLIGILKTNQEQINQKLYQFQNSKNGFYKELSLLPEIYKQATAIKYLSPPEQFCLVNGVQLAGSCDEWKMRQDNKNIIVPPARTIPNTPTTPFSAPLSMMKQLAAATINYLSNLLFK